MPSGYRLPRLIASTHVDSVSVTLKHEVVGGNGLSSALAYVLSRCFQDSAVRSVVPLILAGIVPSTYLSGRLTGLLAATVSGGNHVLR